MVQINRSYFRHRDSIRPHPVAFAQAELLIFNGLEPVPFYLLFFKASFALLPKQKLGSFAKKGRSIPRFRNSVYPTEQILINNYLNGLHIVDYVPSCIVESNSCWAPTIHIGGQPNRSNRTVQADAFGRLQQLRPKKDLNADRKSHRFALPWLHRTPWESNHD